MKVKTVKWEQLKSNMIVVEDIYSKDNQLIMPHGTCLNSKRIIRLKNYGIGEVKIYSDYSAPKDLYDMPVQYSRRVTESKEFRKFNKIYGPFAEELRKEMEAMAGKDGALVHAKQLLEKVDRLCHCGSKRIHYVDIMKNREHVEGRIYGHSINVALLCDMYAMKYGYSVEDRDKIILAGLFHDIGKLTLPDIPWADSQELLTDIDRQILMSHSVAGYDILKRCGLDERICNAVLLHHECKDGSGCLAKEERPAEDEFAWIVAIADTFDLIAISKVICTENSIFEAIQILEEMGQEKFDSEILSCFLSMLASQYINRMVCLSNGIQGEVVMLNPKRLSRPVIKTPYDYIDLSCNELLNIVRVL